MGIKSLNTLLRKHCREVFEEIHISEYAYKKIAIDISLFLCKFKAICGDRWVTAFINLVSCLRRNEIHCVFIYDSGAPPEKDDERAERARQRENNEKRVYELEILLEKYYNTGEIDPKLTEFYENIKDKPNTKRLLSKTRMEDAVDIDIIIKKIEKMRSNVLNISKEDFELTKELFKILHIPFYDAPLEAETTCSDLCKRGLVDAVLSEDTDVLAYSAPFFLTKIDTVTDTCVRISHQHVLDSLELKDNEFLDLCIMCGCDYNKNIPKVGCETSFKYIKKFRNIETIRDSLKLDVSILNHERTRELFTQYKHIDISYVPFCGHPHFEDLEAFVKKHNIKVNTEELKKNFIHNTLIVMEDDEEMIEVEENEDEIDVENITTDDAELEVEEETIEIEVEVEDTLYNCPECKKEDIGKTLVCDNDCKTIICEHCEIEFYYDEDTIILDHHPKCGTSDVDISDENVIIEN